MSRTCDKYEKLLKPFFGKRKERGHMEDVGIDGTIISKRIFGKLDVDLDSGFN